MFKNIFLILLLMTSSAWSQQWRGGTGENTILGTSQSALIGFNSYNKIVQPLDNLLSTYCNQYIQYLSNSTLTISAGSVMVSNSQGSIRLTMLNTSPTTISFSNLDTGSETASTIYYVYVIAATNSSTIATYLISASSTAPSGATYYYQLGNFTTDASMNISYIVNNYWNSYIGPSSTKLGGVVYQALTDGELEAEGACTNSESYSIVTGTTNSPSTPVGGCTSSSSTTEIQLWSYPQIAKGNYYEVTGNGVSSVTWVPEGK